jgi:hypothetical protein
MPSLNEALSTNLENFRPSEPSRSPSISLSASPSTPIRNPFLRCPLPQIWATNTDSLRQTFITMVPQRRLFLPK